MITWPVGFAGGAGCAWAVPGRAAQAVPAARPSASASRRVSPFSEFEDPLRILVPPPVGRAVGRPSGLPRGRLDRGGRRRKGSRGLVAGRSGEGSKVGGAPPTSAAAGLTLLPSPDWPGRGAGSWARVGCAVASALEAFEPATLSTVAPGFAAGSRFKGSVRNGSNGAVEPGFVAGSRFKGSVRNGSNGAVEPGFAIGSRFKGSVRNGLNRAVGPGFAVGSRFRGAVRDGLIRAVHPDFAVGSRFRGSVRNGLNRAVGLGFAVGSRFMGSV